ncbi:MAG: cyclic pyranopterin monophosphate synthase MoaC [Dehalococcoidia bacterium]|nr:cyclic pyranopterin monophosphate synthase MoaC [Dehalococcoidia bacterium]
MITIHTDGACLGNPGPGGWAAIIVRNGVSEELKGREDRTTSNRMEITAAIKGLERTRPGEAVTVSTDSQYLVNTMTQGWKRKVNLDLWTALDRLVSERKVNFEWIRGHAGHPENERANSLANEMAGIVEDASRPTHFDEEGRVHMVDVTAKPVTERVATAKGSVAMKPETLEMIGRGEMRKGNVLAVAQIAGVMASKQTPHLVPLCHPLPLSAVDVKLELDRENSLVDITATVKTSAQTGVEMEALTAVAVSALTVYDMCKAVDRTMRIDGIRLVRKSGGRSGEIILD